MELKISGTVNKILPAQTGTSNAGKDWKKQEFVITTNEIYPKTIAIQAFGKVCEYIDNLQPNDQVEVSFNIESREYQGKYYTQINAWKIQKTNVQAPTQAQAKPQQEEATATTQEGEDLPF